MNYDGLLSSICKYPRKDVDPKENFLTEAFAWLLRTHSSFADYFLEQIDHGLSGKFKPHIRSDNGDWSTQYRLGPVMPDMVFSGDQKAYVFEHKIWSSLHNDQLQNYRNGAKKEWGTNFCLILITAESYLHGQDPDLALVWSDIYNWIEKWQVENKEPSKDSFDPLEDFKDLLLHEGLGPPAPLSLNSMKSYLGAQELEKNAIKFFEKLKNYPDFVGKLKEIEPEGHPFDLEFPIRRNKSSNCYYGRMGLEFYGESWHPNIFLGFLFDGTDHSMPPSDENKGPDIVIVMDFDRKYFEAYKKNPHYEELKKYLAEHCQECGWDFYDTAIMNPKKLNPWHPLCLRKPMVDVFAGSSPVIYRDEEIIFEDQLERFTTAILPALEVLLAQNKFKMLRDDLAP